MQTIKTKYLPATNFKPQRIVATTPSGQRLCKSVDGSYGSNEGHVSIAQELKDRLQWKGSMIGGDTKEGMVFVFVDGPKIE